MRGDGCYTECTVRKLPTMKDGMLKGLLVGVCCIFGSLGILVHPLFLFVAGVLAFVILPMIWPRFSVVYEYVFVDGQLDFDKIMGGSSRKQLKRIDMEQVLTVAPERSHALDSNRNRPEVRKFDFTSGSKDANAYVIINQGQKAVEWIRFEPDETLLSMMKQKSPRKVSEY